MYKSTIESSMATVPEADSKCLHEHSVKCLQEGSSGYSLVWRSAKHKSSYTINYGQDSSCMKHHPLFALEEGLFVMRYKNNDASEGLRDLSLIFLEDVKENPEDKPMPLDCASVIPLASIVHEGDLAAKVVDASVTSASVCGRRVVVCLQLLLHESFLCEVYTSTVFVYDLSQHSVLLTLHPSSLVWPSVCSLNEHQFVLAAVLDAEDASLSLTTIDAKTGHHVAWSSWEDLVDLKGDTFCQLTPSLDGQVLVLTVLENILHDRQILTRTFAVSARTQEMLERYPPRMMSPCHWECIFANHPHISADNSTLTIAFTEKNNGARKVKNTFSLPLKQDAEGS